MTLQDWTDYHEARVKQSAIDFAVSCLPVSAGAALLIAASEHSARDWPEFTISREVVEGTALAMPQAQAGFWLDAVYDLVPGTGLKLLEVIRKVRA